MRKYLFTFILICLYAFYSHFYFLIRYSGHWDELDSATMTNFAQLVQLEATIIPTKGAYANGPGYSTILYILSDLSGVSVANLQTHILPVVGVISIALAFIAFKELTNSKKIALLATFLLALQPDFLFTTSRGTHEKFTFMMVLMSMFFLSRSFSRRKNIREFMYYVLLYYLSILGMMSYNFFFTSTYIFAILVALIIGYLISEVPQITTSFKRMAYTSATSIAFFFSYIFYLYAPSRQLFYMFDTLADKVGSIALATEQHVTPQYSYIFTTWVSFKVWLILTLFNWVIAPLSFIAWILLIYRFFWKKQQLSSSILLLTMFYTAFSIQLLITIFADRFGIFNNIELRIFPVLMFFAIPMASITVMKIAEFERLNERTRKTLKITFIFLIMIFMVSSLLKATNDPIVSNKWFFYSNQEKEGIIWIESSLHGQEIWAGLDERLQNVHKSYSDVETFDSSKLTRLENANYWLISDIIKKRAERIGRPLPPTDNLPIIYDSGNVQIYDSRG